MIPLLDLAIRAHGGITKWLQVQTVDLQFDIGGPLWHAKGLPDGLHAVAHIAPWEQRVRIQPFDVVGTAGYFTPERVWVEDVKGTVLLERAAPRASFAGHTLVTPWDKLHELYFVGYALLNYLSSPFLLADPAFEVEEIEPRNVNHKTQRRMLVRFPAHYPTHSQMQTFYFNEQGLLQRMNYTVDIAQAPGAHYCFDHQEVAGIIIPTHRRVLARNPAKEDPDDLSEPAGVELKIQKIRINAGRQ